MRVHVCQTFSFFGAIIFSLAHISIWDRALIQLLLVTLSQCVEEIMNEISKPVNWTYFGLNEYDARIQNITCMKS